MLDTDSISSIEDTIDQLNKFKSEIVGKATDVVSGALLEFAKILRNEISTLGLEDINRDAIVANLLIWGAYGWALLDFADFELYCRQAPTSCKQADERALSFCTEEEINNLTNWIEAKLRDKNDFRDAIFCFANERWKPCAMLLFATIEAMLIRFQPKTEKRRAVGAKAVDNVKGKMAEINKDNKRFLTYGHHLTTLVALNKMFLYGNDFSNEDNEIINRNFINHGMSQRKVTKTDCIKLFVILDGVLRLFNEYGFTYQS